MPINWRKNSGKSLQESKSTLQKTDKIPAPAIPKSAEGLREYKKQSRETVILYDISGSMSEYIEPGRSKYDALIDIDGQLKGHGFRQFVFNETLQEVVMRIPLPGGGTNLFSALVNMSQLDPKPVTIILVSDGEPYGPGNDVGNLTRLIKENKFNMNIFFVGHANSPGELLLKDLVRKSGGVYDKISLVAEGTMLLANKIAGLLPGAKK